MGAETTSILWRRKSSIVQANKPEMPLAVVFGRFRITLIQIWRHLGDVPKMSIELHPQRGVLHLDERADHLGIGSYGCA